LLEFGAARKEHKLLPLNILRQSIERLKRRTSAPRNDNFEDECPAKNGPQPPVVSLTRVNHHVEWNEGVCAPLGVGSVISPEEKSLGRRIRETERGVESATARPNDVPPRTAPPQCTKESTMLVLSRKKNESIVINDDITIVVVEIRGDKVRLGVEAPKEVPVHRNEVYEAIRRNQQNGDGPSREADASAAE
jgi:carbon storage regulator